MLHIAVLDTDVPVPSIYPSRGLYSSQFRRLLQSAAARLNLPPSTIYTTSFDVIGGCLPPFSSLLTSPSPETSPSSNKANEESQRQREGSNPLAVPISGILITGSGAAAYAPEKHSWITPLQEFIRTVYTSYPGVKIFGSCFGHQLIARALLSQPSPVTSAPCSDAPIPGAIVESCPGGLEVGLTAVTLTPPFAGHFPRLLKNKKQMRLQMIHGDWVVLPSSGISDGANVGLPDGWMNIGSSEKCPVQGLFLPGRLLTFQGHFEFDVEVNRETCVEFGRRNGWCSGDVEGYLESIGRGGEGEEDDSGVAAEVVVSFFLDL